MFSEMSQLSRSRHSCASCCQRSSKSMGFAVARSATRRAGLFLTLELASSSTVQGPSVAALTLPLQVEQGQGLALITDCEINKAKAVLDDGSRCPITVASSWRFPGSVRQVISSLILVQCRIPGLLIQLNPIAAHIKYRNPVLGVGLDCSWTGQRPLPSTAIINQG